MSHGLPALWPLVLATAGPALVEPADPARPQTPLRFEVRVARKIAPRDGRLFVVLGKADGPEPRFSLGHTGLDAPPALARDVVGLDTGKVAVLDATVATFPIDSLGQLPAGDYNAQAVFHSNPDLNLPNAPGDLYGPTRRLTIDPAKGGIVALELSEQVPAETMPAETDLVKFVKLESKLLSKFHGRPISLRAGIILPRDFARETDRRYPLRVHIGGYGARYTGVSGRMREGSAFRRAWMADEAPRMILVQLDGAGPLGDPYQVNSANHGPYGDAITRELIPYIEATYRGIGAGQARVLDGGSTGGWVSLALQVFYPDFFNGCWSSCPDSVDFRDLQLVNIYEDGNAYLNADGFERPAARLLNGDVKYTMSHELQMENLLGRRDSWTLSGGQWGAWNATYGPRSADGRPAPLWNPKTGRIDRSVVDHWKRYDLRLILDRDWKTLGPRLRGKIHVYVGEADDYFLNNAVHRLSDSLSRATDPPFDGVIRFGPGKGHCWCEIGEEEMMKQMAERFEGKK
ncbi:MAG: putative esterase [Planctomycetota bacterium]|nr:putative esterase [Planctomycetota bacterium]